MWEEFLTWIKLKFKIEENNFRPYFYNEGEIWWVNLGKNLGDEENGKGLNFVRPIVVVKKFNSRFCLAIPISSKLKENKYYFKISYGGQYYSALVSQIRALDSKRFRKKIAQLSTAELNQIKKYVIEVIFK